MIFSPSLAAQLARVKMVGDCKQEKKSLEGTVGPHDLRCARDGDDQSNLNLMMSQPYVSQEKLLPSSIHSIVHVKPRSKATSRCGYVWYI